MPLPQPQLVPLIFDGLDTFTDSKKGIATKLDLLENCYVSTPSKLQKRQGYTSQTKNISGGGTLASGQKLVPYRDELLMADGLKLYTKSPIAAGWIPKAKMPSASVVSEKITGDSISTARLNVAAGTASGLTLWAWQPRGTTTITIAIIENSTGAVINTGTITGSMPRIVALAGFVFLGWFDSSVNKLWVSKLDPATPTQLVGTTAIDTQATFVTFDIAPDVTTGKLIVTWFYTGDGTNVHLRTVTPSSMALGTNTTFTHNMAGPPTIRQLVWLTHDYSDGKAYLAVGAPSVPRVDSWDINTTTLAASGQIVAVFSTVTGAVTGYYDVSTTSKTFFGEALGGTSDTTDIIGYYSVGAVPFTLIKGLGISGRVFKQAGQIYLPVFYEDTTQRSRFLLEYDHGGTGINATSAIVGFLGSNDDGGVVGGQTGATTVPCLSDAVNYGSGVWGIPGHYSFDLGAHYGVQNHRITFTEANLSPAEDFADLKLFSGMQLNAYDGGYCVESGFYLKPQAPTVAANAAPGGKNGTYFVKLVYAWTDARGRLWRSVPGPASASVSTGANQRIDVTVKNLRVTNKCPKFNLLATVPLVTIELYCTVAGGTTYYLETTVNNDITANTTAYPAVLGLTDAALAANELLYTTGGVLQNDPIPRPRLVRTFGQRLFACLDRGEIWHTKDAAEGEGAAWSTRFRIPLDTSAGIITALMDMDDQMLFGQRSGIFRLGAGDPSDTGTNLYGAPVRINTEIGPLDQVSVVRLPSGIAYNSPRGIYLMSRGIDAQYIGGPVQRYTKADTVTGAAVMDGVNQARWITSGGDMLVYDHVIGQWFVWTGLAAVATCLYQNMQAILASDGTVKVETAGVYSDDATAIVMKIRTAWISLAGILGYKRLWDVLILGDYKGSHQLQMQLAYNASTFINETLTVNAAAFSYNVDIEAGYVWEAQPKQQICTSVQITLQDVLSGAGSQGFELTGMAVNVGVIPGGDRLAVSHSMG